MIQTLKSKVGALALAGACTFAAAPAAHAVLINTWTIDVVGEFLNEAGFPVTWDESNGSDGARNIGQFSLSWGVATQGNQLSGLDITNTGPAQINTNGAPVNNVTVTHHNFPITGVTLDSVWLRSTVTLTPFDPAGSGLPSTSMEFLIHFKETVNAGFDIPGPINGCEGGGLVGEGINVNGCADVFVIGMGDMSFSVPYDGIVYDVNFFEITGGLQVLDPLACAATGEPSPCVGFLTAENAATPFTFAAVITARVPEPGILATLGIGLLGFAAIRRRRKA